MKKQIHTLLFLSVAALVMVFSRQAQASSLYFYPQNVTLTPGEEVLLDIRLDTQGEKINAVEIEGALSGVAASLRSIDNTGSALSIFVERPALKARSGFRLVGGVPAGIVGDYAVARLSLRAELPGTSVLSFLPNEVRVLLADGTGAESVVSLSPVTIKVLPKSKDYLILSSETHPDQNQWYAATRGSVRFTFDSKSQYSYVITRDALESPDAIADAPEGSAVWDGGLKLDELPEGITYIAIQKLGSATVSRYRFMNDISKPEWIEIGKNEGTVETEYRPFLTFLASDKISGVEYYEMRVDGDEPVTVNSPQPLPDEYTVLSVRAYDRAGNYIEEFIPGPRKDFSLWVWAAVLFVLLVWVSGIIGTGKREQ